MSDVRRRDSPSPSAKLQELLLRRGAVPRLVAILLRFPDQEALEEVCLQALCNLSGRGGLGEGNVCEAGGVRLSWRLTSRLWPPL